MDIFGLLTASAQATGHDLTLDAARLIAQDLAAYQPAQIEQALTKLRRKGGRFGTAAIMEHIQALDGRPSADAAWAEMPKDESDTAIISREMCAAWAVAAELWAGGDRVGAQIAYKREYSAAVDRARDIGDGPGWFASLGHDKARRSDAIAKAVDLGRIELKAAVRLLLDDPATARAITERALAAKSIGKDEFLALAPPLRSKGGVSKVAAIMGPLLDGLQRGREADKK